MNVLKTVVGLFVIIVSMVFSSLAFAETVETASVKPLALELIGADTQEACPCGTVIYTFKITNNEEAGKFKITLDGFAKKWATLSEDEAELDKNEELTLYLYVTPSCFVLSETEERNFAMTLNVNDADGKESASQSIILRILPCRELRIYVPEKVEQCACETKDIKFTVKNTGERQEDVVLGIIAKEEVKNMLTLSKNAFSLKPKQEEEIAIKSTMGCNTKAGEYLFSIEAKSKGSYAQAEKNTTIVAQACYDAEASLNDIIMCLTEDKITMLSLRNTGLKEDNYLIEIKTDDSVELEYYRMIEVEANKTVEIPVAIKPKDVGAYRIDVKIESNNTKISAAANLKVEKCYGVEASFDKKDEKCPCGVSQLKLNVRNTGNRADNFSITFSEYEKVAGMAAAVKEVALGPNESKSLDEIFVINCNAAAGEYSIAATAASKKASTKAETVLTVLGPDKCYKSEVIVAAEKILVKKWDRGELVKIMVKNAGSVEDTYEITQNVSFASLNKKQITLKPGETGIALVYIIPQYETLTGLYTMSVSVKSPFTAYEKNIQVDVKELPREQNFTSISSILNITKPARPALPNLKDMFASLRASFASFIDFHKWLLS